jgi:cytosol alanyl aminopeptidase
MRTPSLRFKLILLLPTLLVSLGSLFAQSDPSNEFRLPHTALPTDYKLDLTIRPDETAFQGVAIIKVELKERTRVVWLNAKDLSIKEIHVTSGTLSKTTTWRTSGEFLAVGLSEATGPGPLQLDIRYTAALPDKTSVGAYRRKSGEDWYVYTSFMPIDARRAFPCFDEPEYKTPWTIVLHVKANDVAVSNAPAVSTKEEPDGMKRVEFAPTQPLPSEAIAFAVGPFDVVDAGVAGKKQIPVRIITPRGRADEAGPASKVTAEILPLLEQYTGIPYPWDKLDHIAVLGMTFAVENPGLITYGLEAPDGLLTLPARDTPRRQRAMRSFMTHEMAHQWFGNLVTQSWWNDVWLSEGFATWLESKISDSQLPPFERSLEITGMRNSMLLSDSPATRPVRVQVHNRKETDAVYDAIVYVKGASILQMLEDWIGREGLQRSLRRYLSDHAFKNATSEDLAKAINEETSIDVGPVLFAFLDRPGAPILHFSVESSKLYVQQSSDPWAVPVCIHVDDSKAHCEVVTVSRAEIHISSQPHWVWPNAYGSGYYRSDLTGELFETLMQQGYSQLQGSERLALVADVEGLTSSGDLPVATALKFMQRFAMDSDPRVRERVFATALELGLLAPDAARPRYAEWLDKTLKVPRVSPAQSRDFEEFFRDKPEADN